MAQKSSLKPLVSIVNYDMTSSDQNLSEIESADGQAFVYASCELPAPRLSPVFSESDASTQSESEEDVATRLDITEPDSSPFRPRLASISVEKPREKLDERLAGGPTELSHSDEEKNTSVAGPSAKKIKVEVLEISSSSSEPDEQPTAEEVAGNKKKRAYALKMAELPAEMRRFLAASRSFHTRAHSLERPTAAVSASTYDKAEERLLCKYFGHVENCA